MRQRSLPEHFNFKRGLFALLVLTVPPLATAGSFEIDWWTIDAGGTIESEAADWSLQGTIGQWDVSDQSPSGGSWELQGGFWGFDAPERNDRLFRDRFELVPASTLASSDAE